MPHNFDHLSQTLPWIWEGLVAAKAAPDRDVKQMVMGKSRLGVDNKKQMRFSTFLLWLQAAKSFHIRNNGAKV